ncbi:hypothetical protein B296_00034460 [Ensete ventricosum]|uniref:Uncharacterized protein n=1 Tax=Ensete ventricosum TaxID=4639 RepID=A0A426Y0B6_ENSVE|nr:hypothetical protein B296_00034460 [Ensete ventricosum]
MLRHRTGHDSVKRLPLDKRRDGSFEGFSFSPSAILLVPFVIDLKAAIEATPQEIRRSFLCTRTCREIRLKRCFFLLDVFPCYSSVRSPIIDFALIYGFFE